MKFYCAVYQRCHEKDSHSPAPVPGNSARCPPTHAKLSHRGHGRCGDTVHLVTYHCSRTLPCFSNLDLLSREFGSTSENRLSNATNLNKVLNRDSTPNHNILKYWWVLHVLQLFRLLAAAPGKQGVSIAVVVSQCRKAEYRVWVKAMTDARW